MNPGYISMILMVSTLILLFSGWKDTLLRGISPQGLLLFFIGIVTFSFFSISWGSPVHIHLALVWLSIAAAAALLRQPALYLRIHLLSAALLIGSIAYLLQQIYSMNPMLIIYSRNVDIAIGLSLLAFLLTRETLQQFICLTAGLVMAEVLPLWTAVPKPTEAWIGGPAFMDRWWMTIVAVRLVTVIVSALSLQGRAMVKMLAEWKRG